MHTHVKSAPAVLVQFFSKNFENTGADTGGVDRVDIQPPFFSKKKFEMSLYLK